MNIFSVAVFSLVACVLSVLMKQYRPEFSLVLSIVAGTLIFLYIINALRDVFSQVLLIFTYTGQNSEHISLLLKALGVSFIAQMAYDNCIDSGQSAIAHKVEMAGKVSLFLLAMPLFTDILRFLSDLLYR